VLIIFGGLPATGKRTLSRELARTLVAVHLRIDTIEQRLRDVGCDVSRGQGYEVAYALAADNLMLGHIVIADSVNPITLTRQAWRDVAMAANAPFKEVEIVCSDIEEHQSRVQNRHVDIKGLALPTWQDITRHDYEPWCGDIIRIDTAGKTPQQSTQ